MWGRSDVWTHLIGLVVILRIVLEQLWFFRIVKVRHERVSSEFRPPFLASNEPEQQTHTENQYIYTLHIHTRIQQNQTETAYMFFAASTLNFLALRNLSSVIVSNRSLYPSSSRVDRSWNTCASCSAVVYPGWPDCGVAAVVGWS